MTDLATQIALWSMGALFLLFIAVVFWTMVEEAMDDNDERGVRW